MSNKRLKLRRVLEALISDIELAGSDGIRLSQWANKNWERFGYTAGKNLCSTLYVASARARLRNFERFPGGYRVYAGGKKEPGRREKLLIRYGFKKSPESRKPPGVLRAS